MAASDLETRQVLDCLRRIVRALRLTARSSERELGVSAAQLFVMRRLKERPGASVNELAALTYTHQSSVSVVVKRLVAQGMLARRPSPKDARRMEITLTAKGRARVERSAEPVQASLVEALQRLRGPERRALARSLCALVGELGADAGAPAMFFEEEAADAHPTRRRRPARR